MIWHTEVKANVTHKNSFFLKQAPPPPPPPPPPATIRNENEDGVKFKDLLRKYWQTYCEKSTIHGVRYIYDPTLRAIERLIWTALTLTCFAYFILSERYSAQKLQTVVENSQFPVFRIPFPAVSICTQNRLNWQKFEQAKAKFLAPSAGKAELEVFTDFVKRMETFRFARLEAFTNMEDINLELIDGIDVTELAEFMAINCEDILVNATCTWRKMSFDCCSRFMLEHTEYGYCLVFNSELSPPSSMIQNNGDQRFYPYHNSRAGQGTGLSFQVKLHSKYKSPTSKAESTLTVLIKRPDQLTNVGYTITPQTLASFVVRPQITESDDDLHSLDPVKRNCYFEDETYLLRRKSNMTSKSMLNNCLNICHKEHVLKYCNCSLPLFFLFPDQAAEKCRPSKFRCLGKNSDIFSCDKHKEEDAYFSSAKPGMTCSCLTPCNAIEYFTSLTTLPSCTKKPNDTNIEIYEVDVHYQSEVLIRYRTSLEFTIIDLIANFGGIFGLCLGASLVSAVELLYYATFGFGLYLYDNNYYAVFRANLRNLKHNWAVGLKNSLSEECDDGSAVYTASPLKHRHQHQHKHNHW